MTAEPQKKIPQSLYKYRQLGLSPDDLDRIRQAIVERKIWWPSPLEFNDPFDCAPAIRFPRGRELQAMAMKLHRKHNPDAPRKERREFRKLAAGKGSYNYQEDFKNNLRDLMEQSSVYSLGERPDDILMWSHYANSHKGICLRFDTELLIKAFVLIAPVCYSTDRPEVFVGKEEPVALLEKMLLTKSTEWTYEQEWRLLAYKQGRGLRDLPEGCLTGVVLGMKAQEDERHAVAEFIAASGQQIALYRAEQDERMFAVNLVPVNDTARDEAKAHRQKKVSMGRSRDRH